MTIASHGLRLIHSPHNMHIHQYLQKIINLTRIYDITGSWNLHNLEIGSINFELPYIRQLWMFIFQIWHALCQSISSLFGDLHMFIHQLGRKIWTNMWSAHFFGRPCMIGNVCAHASHTYIADLFICYGLTKCVPNDNNGDTKYYNRK